MTTFFLKSGVAPVHHRESSAGVWRRWSMDRRQNCCDESALDLPRSPAVFYPAQSVGRVVFSDVRLVGDIW